MRGAVFAQICLLSDNWEQCAKFSGAKQSIDSDADASFYIDTVDIRLDLPASNLDCITKLLQSSS